MTQCAFATIGRKRVLPLPDEWTVAPQLLMAGSLISTSLLMAGSLVHILAIDGRLTCAKFLPQVQST